MGNTASLDTPAEFGRLIAEDSEKWKVIAFAGISRTKFSRPAWSCASRFREACRALVVAVRVSSRASRRQGQAADRPRRAPAPYRSPVPPGTWRQRPCLTDGGQPIAELHQLVRLDVETVEAVLRRKHHQRRRQSLGDFAQVVRIARMDQHVRPRAVVHLAAAQRFVEPVQPPRIGAADDDEIGINRVLNRFLDLLTICCGSIRSSRYGAARGAADTGLPIRWRQSPRLPSSQWCNACVRARPSRRRHRARSGSLAARMSRATCIMSPMLRFCFGDAFAASLSEPPLK